MAKVDIVVPCYNYGRFLETCVRSVLEQSVTDLRVLIIDDASSDNSLPVAKSLADTDRRVSIISHPQNWGHIHTYNQGIAWASADYFLLLSADDLLVPGALERATKVMDENPDIVLTHGAAIVWADHLPLPEVHQQRSFFWARQDLIKETCALGCNLVHTPTTIARTSVQKAIGGYCPSLPHSGDMEMWLRFAAHGPIARLDTVQAIYRRHSSNMSTPYFSKKLPEFVERKKAFDRFFEKYSYHVTAASTLRIQVDRVVSEKVYISGIARLCGGNIRGGFQLLSYSVALNSKLRYFPPIALLIKLKIPSLDKVAVSLGFWRSDTLQQTAVGDVYSYRHCEEQQHVKNGERDDRHGNGPGDGEVSTLIS
jgi:glycosyltransferase involved in cell wall biosynthesis